MGMRGRRQAPRIAAAMAALLFTLSTAQLARPQPAAAAADTVGTASTTYAVNPGDGRIDVAIDYVLKNNKAATTSLMTCQQWVWDYWIGWYLRNYTCPQTTTYYVNVVYVSMEHEATAIKVTADVGSASASLYKAGTTFDEYRISFTDTYGGVTRRLHIAYQLPGGAPRSDSHIRMNAAAVAFCAITNGPDGGSLKVSMPSGYDVGVDEHGGTMAPTTADGVTTYDSGALKDTRNFWVCFNGENPGGYESTQVTSPGGRQVKVMGWPGDAEWQQKVATDASTSLAALEQLIGRALPGSGAIAIHEVADGALGAYAGSFDAKAAVARVRETIQSGVVAHELSHGWFNAALFNSNWLREGSADWAESVVTRTPCKEPGAYPVAGVAPNIADWRFAGPTADDTQRAIVGWQYNAACAVVGGVAAKAGTPGMQQALAALIDGKSAYQSAAATLPTRTGAADWRAWLDAVDELGLVPAGVTDLEFAQNLVVLYGGNTVNADALKLRSSARAAYHALLAKAGDWAMPAAVLAPLDSWSFARANDVLASAAAVIDAAHKADTLVPRANVLAGALRTRFQETTDPAVMKEVEAAAADQVTAAEAVAAALLRVAAPRPGVEALGLTPNAFGPEVDAALGAVAAADLPAATVAVAALDQKLADEAAAAQAVTDAKAGIDAPRDPLRWIGLLGADFGPQLSTAMAAVGAADVAGAQGATAAINQVLADSPVQGAIRLAVVLALVLLMVGIAFVLRRRRARARLAAATAVGATTAAGATTATGSGAAFALTDTVLAPTGSTATEAPDAVQTPEGTDPPEGATEPSPAEAPSPESP